ncbi:MAG: hypothetical protein HY681_01060 [Chloroflexi bacterium]|nr:hypothetical protein [Chloroflexota bacterium]
MPEVFSPLAEVIATASAQFTAQCYELYGAPPLGALVRAGEDAPVPIRPAHTGSATPIHSAHAGSATYAVVCNVVTEGVDPSRKPVARGQGLPDEASVYRDNPQLPKLLRTSLQAAIVGWRDASGSVRYGLPPSPPRIHAFVHACAPEEVCAFTQRLDFLPLLLSSANNEGGPALTDQVAAAFLRQAASAHPDPQAFLVGAGRQLARLLARDAQRLQPILQGLHG